MQKGKLNHYSMFEGIFNSNNILSINFALKQAKHNNLTTKQAALHRCQDNILKKLQIKKKWLLLPVIEAMLITKMNLIWKEN